MKAKKQKKIVREQLEAALRHNYKFAHSAFCRLNWKERLRIAWLLIRGDADLEKAVR
jgi:hypothetical protein